MAKEEKKLFFFIGNFFLILILLNFVVAQNNINSINSSTNLQQQNIIQNKTAIEKAYECLENELKNDCSGATNVQQLAFSILATPKTDILKKCVESLEAKEKPEGCFGDSSCTIKDTALAILALNHARKNTTKYENWILSKKITSSEVEWILQQDSEGETNCILKYDGTDYSFKASENKKLTGYFGPCFNPIYQNYWLGIEEDCLSKNFKIGCDKRFLISFLFRTPNSNRLNILSNTKEATQNTEISFSIESFCFGQGGSCNYEDNAWAILALKIKGHNIKDYIPYLVTAEDNNKGYFPEIFSYLVLENDRLYGEKIIKMQTEANYWEVEDSVYGRYYDTALALLALGDRNQEKINEAKKWVFFMQESNGCWNSKNIRDSSFLLWALERKNAPALQLHNVVPVTSCSQAPSGSSCIRETECLNSGGSVLKNYDCSYAQTTFTAVCCNITPSLKSCRELNGEICSSEETCEGVEKDSINGKCCLGSCKKVNKVEGRDECKIKGGFCRTECKKNEEKNESLSCSERNKICCVEKKKEKSLVWLWLLLGILILLAIIGILMKDKIKVMLYKIKEKKKEGDNKKPFSFGPSGPFNPSKPSFPPATKTPIFKPSFLKPIKQQNNPQKTDIFNKMNERRNAAPSIPDKKKDVFEKLREISK